MAKKKHRFEEEQLKGIIRKQEKQLKHLKKEVVRKDKRSHQYQDLEVRIAEELLKEQQEENQKLSKHRCPKCNEDLEEIKVGNRVIFVCECGYRCSKKI